jgi:hypothetical protein
VCCRLGQIQSAEIADERTVPALREAVEAAATTHDIEIEPLSHDEDDADRPC